MRINDAVSKRDVEHVKYVIRVAQFEILKSKSYSWKPFGFFQFYRFAAEIRTSSIDNAFNFDIPVITAFSREVQKILENNFFACVLVCVFVCVFACVCFFLILNFHHN